MNIKKLKAENEKLKIENSYYCNCLAAISKYLATDGRLPKKIKPKNQTEIMIFKKLRFMFDEIEELRKERIND